MDKKHELLHLKRFKENCTFFPDGEIECTERPDFIIHLDDKLIGIEHTQIFQPGPPDGSSLQAQAVLLQKIVKKASELYLRQHNKPLFVWVTFRLGIYIRNREIDHLAEIIYRLVERELLIPGKMLSLHRTHDNFDCFPTEIAVIYIYSNSNGREN